MRPHRYTLTSSADFCSTRIEIYWEGCSCPCPVGLSTCRGQSSSEGPVTQEEKADAKEQPLAHPLSRIRTHCMQASKHHSKLLWLLFFYPCKVKTALRDMLMELPQRAKDENEDSLQISIKYKWKRKANQQLWKECRKVLNLFCPTQRLIWQCLDLSDLFS